MRTMLHTKNPSSYLIIAAVILMAIVILGDVHCEAKKSWADIASANSAPDVATISREGSVYKPTKPKQQQKQANGATARNALSRDGVYKQLPKDAERFRVRNVYDGDTLTLVDETRVRLIGIDTPEIAEGQAFAQEAKKYTKDLCHKKDIYISFDPKGDKEDKYGRLVAYVWVEVDGGYLCVNEGIVAAGLATVYLATKEVKPKNFKHMLTLQKAARAARRGIWSVFVDYNVLVSRYGSAFHKAGCRHIARSKGLKTIKASDATDQGLHPCRTCLADK